MIELEKKTPREKWVEWVEKLDPSKRKQLTLMGGGGLLFVVAAILITATSDDNAKNFIQKPRKVEYTLFNGKSPRDVSIDAMAGKIKKLTEDFSDIRGTFQRQDQKIHEASELIKMRSDELNKRTEKLAQQTNELYQKLEVAQDALKNQVPLPEIPVDDKSSRKSNGKGKKDTLQPELLGQQPPTIAENEVAPAESGPKIRVVTGSGEESKKKTVKAQKAPMLTEPKKPATKKLPSSSISNRRPVKTAYPTCFYLRAVF